MSDYSPEPIEPVNGRDERRERRERRDRSDRHRGSAGVLFAVALIVVGAAVLMNNMGIAAINWREALRYWPVVLILFGLDMMIGRQTAAGSAVMAVVTIAALLGVFWLSGQVPIEQTQTPDILAPAKAASGTISEDLKGAKKLQVNVELSQMALTLGAQKDGSLAAQGDWKTIDTLKPTIEYEVDDEGLGVLTISQPDHYNGLPPFATDSAMTLNLPTGIPIELTAHSDLGSVKLELDALTITTLEAGTSSGNLTITLPEVGQIDEANIHADLGSVTVSTPDKATLNIDTLDVSASSGNVTLGLPGKGTIGDLTVKSDLGAVTVNVPDDSTLNLDTVDIGSSSGNVTVELPSQGKAGDVTISCDLGAVNVTIPGESNTLSVSQFDVTTNSGNLSVVLPGGKGDYPANIQADLGSVTVTLPAGLEAHVTISGGLAKPDVTSKRLVASGNVDWETAGYQEGDHRVLVSIDASSGSVTVKDE